MRARVVKRIFPTGSFRRRVPLRDTERRTTPESTGVVRETIVEFPEKPAAGMVPADRQPPGHETLRQQKGARERKNQTKNCRTLGHPPMQLISVSVRDDLLASESACGGK